MRTSELPDMLPLFVLPSAILLPRAELPLNVFEPRYLRMVDDALQQGHRMIGVIQPKDERADGEMVDTYQIGGAGRIIAFAETGDGRYMITLGGVRRFKVSCPIAPDLGVPYMQAEADWGVYPTDATADDDSAIDRDGFLSAVRQYFSANDFETDWDEAENMPLEAFVSLVASGCPFGNAEKQALLEAPSLEARAQLLITLMSMAMPGDSGASQQLQ